MARGAGAKFPPGHRVHASQSRCLAIGSTGGVPTTRGDTARSIRSTRGTSSDFSSPGRGRWITQALRSLRHLSTTGSCICRTRTASSRRLDAATGDLLWEYRPERAKASGGAGGEGNGVQRNIAIYGDKIFGTTGDAHIIAVDARTGKLVWDTQVADHKLGYEYTSGPIVVRGKVIAGMTGAPTTKRTSASSPGTMRKPERRSGEHRLLPVPVSPAATLGATCHWSSARVVTRGSPAATIRKRTPSIGARRRPNRGLERPAEPTATRSIPTRRWRSIRTRGK